MKKSKILLVMLMTLFVVPFTTVFADDEEIAEESEAIVVEEVKITNATLDFKKGDTPSYTAKVDGEGYEILYEGWCVFTPSINNEVWVCNWADELEDDHTDDEYWFDAFEAKAYTYNLEIVFEEGYVPSEDIKFYVNGNEVYFDYYDDEGTYYAYNEEDLSILNLYEDVDGRNAVEAFLEFNNTGQNVLNGESDAVSDEIIEAILDALESQQEVSVSVNIEDMTDEEKAEVLEKISEILKGDKKAGAYLNITVSVDFDNDPAYNLTKFDNPFKVTIEIPSDIPELKSGYTRTYTIIRIHDDEVDEITDVTVNDNGTLTFKTDRFSSYVLTYTDTVNPDTSDNAIVNIIVGMISLFAVVAVAMFFKKSRFNN